MIKVPACTTLKITGQLRSCATCKNLSLKLRKVAATVGNKYICDLTAQRVQASKAIHTPALLHLCSMPGLPCVAANNDRTSCCSSKTLMPRSCCDILERFIALLKRNLSGLLLGLHVTFLRLGHQKPIATTAIPLGSLMVPCNTGLVWGGKAFMHLQAPAEYSPLLATKVSPP